MSTIPGSYADKKDFLDYYSEIEGIEVSTPDTADSSLLGTVRVRKAVIAATNYINSKISNRYETPLKNWGAEITRVTCAIAMHDNLDMLEIREATEKRYKKVIEWLNEIRNGEADLIDDTGKPIPEKLGALNDKWAIGPGLTLI